MREKDRVQEGGERKTLKGLQIKIFNKKGSKEDNLHLLSAGDK